MNDEQSFLESIDRSPDDESSRLVYADWLEERGDAERAEFLRVEGELRRTWTWTDQQPGLLARLAAVRPKLDAAWLARFRRLTTPPPFLDVEALLPELKGRSRTAIRLHPRRGETEVDASKLGGRFLWPADEPWPSCEDHGRPFVAALQLRKEDVGDVAPFKGDADLLQVLWCPEVAHSESWGVFPRLFWRRRSDVKDVLDDQPTRPADPDGPIPEPCVLRVERVTEYPHPFDFEDGFEPTEEFLAAVESLPIESKGDWDVWNDEDAYVAYASTTLGTKVGGYPDWVYETWEPTCSACGSPMDHLVTFGSSEFDSVTWGRWLPIEERDILATGDDVGPDWDDEVVQSACKGPNWEFGDGGSHYVFVCRQCPDWPIVSQRQTD